MSEKVYDRKNRWRSKVVSFNASPEEATQLDRFVRISGLRKQDYLISRVLQREVTVVGSPRLYKALKTEMAEILDELRRMEQCSDADDEFLDVLRLMAQIVDGMKGEPR